MRVRDATLGDAEAIARVHVDTWRTTYQGIVPDAFLDGLSYGRSREMWQRAFRNTAAGRFVCVVEEEVKSVAGFVAGGPEREDRKAHEGEIYAIYLLAQHQGKGWGRALFMGAAERLRTAGMGSLMLWVLEENPSRGFYEALGGIPGRTKDLEIGGSILAEVAYRWDRLDLLATTAT